MRSTVRHACPHRQAWPWPVATRVFRALELLKPAVGASAAQLCLRLRTACAILDAWGLTAGHGDRPPAPGGVPQTLAPFRRRIDALWREALWALPAAAPMEAGLARPAPLRGATVPAAQRHHRVTDATTLYKAQQTAARLSRAAHRQAPRPRRRYSAMPHISPKPSGRSGAAVDASVVATARGAGAWCARQKHACLLSGHLWSLWPRPPRRVCLVPRRCARP